MQRWETLFSNIMGGVCGNRSSKQRLIDLLFLMEVEMGWKQAWGMWGGRWLLQGGRIRVSGASSNVNVGCVHLSAPRPAEGSPPSHGCGHGLPVPFEPPRPEPLTLICLLETRAQQGEGAAGAASAGQTDESSGGALAGLSQASLRRGAGAPTPQVLYIPHRLVGPSYCFQGTENETEPQRSKVAWSQGQRVAEPGWGLATAWPVWTRLLHRMTS